MATSLSIFILGINFALIYLYSITRDRWNWSRIILWASIPLTLLFVLILYIVFKIFKLETLYTNLLVISGASTLLLLVWQLTKRIWAWRKILSVLKKTCLSIFVIYALYYAFTQAQNYYIKKHYSWHRFYQVYKKFPLLFYFYYGSSFHQLA